MGLWSNSSKSPTYGSVLFKLHINNSLITSECDKNSAASFLLMRLTEELQTKADEIRIDMMFCTAICPMLYFLASPRVNIAS